MTQVIFGTEESGTVVFDPDTLTVKLDGQTQRVEPQVFDVLAYLIANRERVVAKEELLDNVWGDRFISDSAVTSRIKSARKCVGDDGRRQLVIRTVHGRGYQFVADLTGKEPVSVGAVAPSETATAVDDPAPSAARALVVGPPATDTVGRDGLIADIGERLGPGRVVTLLGPAGVGKTHLAQRVASTHGAEFVDGAWFVPLANVRDPGAVGSTILDVLGQPQFLDASAQETIVTTLQSQSGLLVLDNCEHVIDAVADLIKDLATSCRSMAVLATSRQRLSVPGEFVVDVPVLDATASTALFAARADEHGVQLDPNSTEVGQICALLDNLPLAIELACAHTRVLTLDQLTGLLDERMSLLAASHPVDAHHQTLEGAIATSFDALDESLQETLCRFSVFVGPFGLEAASAIARGGDRISHIEAIQHLVALSDRSLIVVDGSDSEPRYRLLESVRLFASQRLSNIAQVQLMHVEHYCDLAEKRCEALHGHRLQDAFGEVTKDWDNYRAAVGYAVAHDHLDAAARLLAATEDFAAITQRYEHAEWAEMVLDASDDADLRLESVRAGLSRFLVFKDFDRAKLMVDRLVDSSSHFGALDAAAWWYYLGTDHDSGDKMIQDMLDATSATTGLQSLYANGVAVFLRSTSPGKDLMTPLQRIRADGAHHGTIGAAFVALAEARYAFAQEDTTETIRQCGRTLELAELHGLGILVLGAARARSMGLATHDDYPFVAEQLLDSLMRYERRGSWTPATIEAPLVARVLLETDRIEPAARVLGAYVAAGYAKSWSAEVAAPLIDRVRAEFPDHASALDEGTLRGSPLRGAELCRYCIERLSELIASEGAGAQDA